MFLFFNIPNELEVGLIKVINDGIEDGKKSISDAVSYILKNHENLTAVPLKTALEQIKNYKSTSEGNVELSELVKYYIDVNNKLFILNEYLINPQNFNEGQLTALYEEIDAANEIIILNNIYKCIYNDSEAYDILALINAFIPKALKEKINDAFIKYKEFIDNKFVTTQREEFLSHKTKLSEHEEQIIFLKNQCESLGNQNKLFSKMFEFMKTLPGAEKFLDNTDALTHDDDNIVELGGILNENFGT